MNLFRIVLDETKKNANGKYYKVFLIGIPTESHETVGFKVRIYEGNTLDSQTVSLIPMFCKGFRAVNITVKLRFPYQPSFVKPYRDTVVTNSDNAATNPAKNTTATADKMEYENGNDGLATKNTSIFLTKALAFQALYDYNAEIRTTIRNIITTMNYIEIPSFTQPYFVKNQNCHPIYLLQKPNLNLR